MTAVFRMVISKLRSRRLQTGILLGGSFLLSFFGLGILLLCFALNPSFDASYRKLDAPDFCANIDETEADWEALETFLKKLSYVERYEISQRYLVNHVELTDRTMDFAYLAFSEELSPGSGQVMINPAVSGTKCGDIVRFSMDDRRMEFCVESVIEDPVNSAPDNKIPYFYLNSQELAGIVKHSEKGSFYIKLYTAMENGQEDCFLNDFETYFGRTFPGELYTMEDIRHSFLFRYDMIKDFAVFFFAFLFLIFFILIILLTQMEVYGDTSVIGTLKSMGFTDGKVCLIYIFRSLFLAVLGSAAGMAVCKICMGHWLDGMFAAIGKGVFSFRHAFIYELAVMAFLCLVMAVSVGITSIRILCRGHLYGAYHLQKTAQIKNISHDKKGLYLLQKPGDLCLSLGLHKCRRQKLETLLILCLSMGIGALGLTAFYLINGVSQADRHLADWGLVDMDIYVARKTDADERASGLLDRLEEAEEVDYYYAGLTDEVVCQIGQHGQKKRVLGEIYGQKIPDQISFTFLEGRNPQNDREVSVGMNFARENQVTLGDELILIHGGEEKRLLVVGIYPSYKAYANSIRLITQDIQAFFENRAEGYYSVVLREGEDAGSYASKLGEEFADFSFYPMQRSVTRFVKNLLYPLAGVMMFLLAVYLFLLILLKRWMYIECAEEFVLWYHIGMTKKKIGRIISFRFMIPVITGAVIAVPLSLYGFPVWMGGLAKRLGLLKLPVYPDVPMVTAAVFMVLAVGFLATVGCKDAKGKIPD